MKYVARKLMKVPSDFRKEKDNLLKLHSSLSNHDRIIKYLAIIIIGEPDEAEEFNILMPLATMNLKVFLEQDPSLAPSFKLKDLLLQAANVADAIQWLHGGLPIKDRVYICCHMDLTPVNFLVFLDEANIDEPVGKWKVADFSISTLQELETEQRSSSNRSSDFLKVESPARTLALLTVRTARMDAARPAGPFHAPEVRRGSNVGRASDIWSFGYILFQILARGVGPGTDTLKKLDSLRCFEKDGITDHPTDYFYRERGDEKYVNPHVTDWLEKSLLNGSYLERQYVQLCKELISKMLQIDHEERPKAYQVNRTLWEIIRRPDKVLSLVLQQSSAASLQPGRNIASGGLPVPELSVTDLSGEESNSSLYDNDRRLALATININDFNWNLPPRNIEHPLSNVTEARSHRATDDPTQFQPVTANVEGGNNQTPQQLSSMRSQSVTETIVSFISVESIKSSLTPFKSVSNVIQSLISGTGNLVFITKEAIYVRDIRLDSRFYTMRVDNLEWEHGSIAGDYVLIIGKPKENGSTRKTRIYRLCQLSSNGVLQEPRFYQVLDLRGDIEDVTVSPQRNLIIKRGRAAQLYLNNNHSIRNLIVCPNIQGVFFGAFGIYAFLKISLGSNIYKIGVWHVADLQYTNYIYMRQRVDSTAELVVIPFPSSPWFILWDEYDKLWFLGPDGTPEVRVNVYPTMQEKRLQAIAVSPDERYVVFVTGFSQNLRPKSRLSVRSLRKENQILHVGDTIKEKTLNQSLSHFKQSAVLVQAVQDMQLTVIIAHKGGTYEKFTI